MRSLEDKFTDGYQQIIDKLLTNTSIQVNKSVWVIIFSYKSTNTITDFLNTLEAVWITFKGQFHEIWVFGKPIIRFIFASRSVVNIKECFVM
jgi:hypothetical protein